MAAFKHSARKHRRAHRHVLSLNFKNPEVKALAPRLEREIRALFRKFDPIVQRAKKAAAKRMARKRGSR